MRNFLSVFSLVVLLALTAVHADVPLYVTDLGVFQPQVVSNHGDVAGMINAPQLNLPLAIYSQGHVQAIQNPNFRPFSFNNVTAATFTDNGKLGFAADVFFPATQTTNGSAPVIYDTTTGAFTLVPGVTGLQTAPNSWGITNAGTAGGFFLNFLAGNGYFAFDGTNSTSVHDSNRFYAPNNRGQQIGAVPQNSKAAILENGTITTLVTSRGDPIFQSSLIPAINDLDDVIINGSLGKVANGVYTPLPNSGILTGTFVSLSNSGTAVGSYQTGGAGGTSSRALYYDGMNAVDLNTLIDPTSGWILTSATDISDTGYIIGQGVHDGTISNFLITPVPEPIGGLALIAASLLMRRRNHNFNRQKED